MNQHLELTGILQAHYDAIANELSYEGVSWEHLEPLESADSLASAIEGGYVAELFEGCGLDPEFAPCFLSAQDVFDSELPDNPLLQDVTMLCDAMFTPAYKALRD